MKFLEKTVLLFLIFHFNVEAQTNLSADLDRIKEEGFQRSQVQETLIHLSDIYGQRLTGSREYFRAAQWAKAQLEDWKIDNAHFENYCNDCRGWGIKTFNAEMISPIYLKLMAYPLAMVQGTDGEITGTPIHIPDRADLQAVKAKFGGQLKGKIVLSGKPPVLKTLTDPLVDRRSAEAIAKLENALAPSTTLQHLPDLLESWLVDVKADSAFMKFLESEGALASFTTTPLNPGVIHAQGTYFYRETHIKPLPSFALAPEHFNKIVRMLERNETPDIRLNLETEFYMEPQNNVNIIGEIPGGDPRLKSEVVLIGAHFDSWHAGSGTTDNGTGVAVMMEVLRIIKATGIRPKRTIRMGLWGGEEQGYLGSVAYAKANFGQFGTKPLPDSRKVSAYVNMDNGAGAMRGIYLQGNAAARTVFEEVLKPFDYLGATTVTIENTMGTDHDVFDYYNIPSFQIIQDWLGYYTLTHHTNLDLVEYAPEEDLKKNSVILAGMIYQLAMREEKVPRKK
ncbi:MAG: M20/M25/M40 family metallo-hydrolase [Cyclobacteriaceae bacterium]